MNEQEVLEKIPDIFRQGSDIVAGPGDDCAVLDIGLDKLFLIAADQVVSGVHYDSKTTSPEQAAAKLLKRNISDIAAMGGIPAHAVMTMALSPHTASGSTWITRFLEGLASEADKWGISVCGGDISSSGSGSTDIFSLTITGMAEKECLCLRSNAEEGDILFTTGCFGNSYASGHHITFTPRLDEARFLAGKYTSAMIDISDGLIADAAKFAEKSGVSFMVDTAAVPPRDGAALREALTDGEDYELLFAVPPAKAGELSDKWPFEETPLTRIGSVTAGKSGLITDTDGETLLPQANAVSAGYVHFPGT